MTGFQESDPTVEGRRVEAFQMATSGARVGKASSFRVARDPPGVHRVLPNLRPITDFIGHKQGESSCVGVVSQGVGFGTWQREESVSRSCRLPHGGGPPQVLSIATRRSD